MPQQNTITILPLQQCRILKMIRIISDKKGNSDVHLGTILYLRKFSQDYTIREIPENQRDASYYVQYPPQSIFPNDAADNLILQSVKNQYPKSSVWNRSIITSTDTEFIKVYQRSKATGVIIDFTPNFSGVDWASIHGKTFPRQMKTVKIYSDLTKKEITNIQLFGYYDLNDQTILLKLKEVQFI